MSLSISRLLALTPIGHTHPGLVVAASRCGGLGILDFGLRLDVARAREAMRGVTRHTEGPYGLRLPADALSRWYLESSPQGLALLVCTEPASGEWGASFSIARQAGRVAMAEVTSRASALAAVRAGAEALVVAGQEAGGRGGEESTFVLLQGVLAEVTLPVWVRGAGGPRVAAACMAAGARGVVLDGALLLARESPLVAAVRERLERWDGSETLVFGHAPGWPLRLHAAPGSPLVPRLRQAEAGGAAAWAEAVGAEVGWRPDQAWPAGQDAALAAGLARRYVTVGGILQAFERAMDEGPRIACRVRPLAEGAPLARSHGTRYPIVQGPMTRVSDTVAFAVAVAAGGALPFLALALMRGPEVQALLSDASRQMAGRPWGVGILGFVPPELRLEQIAAIRQVRPPFALIAGGRPDQARELEREGIPTYLHAPSPGLLRHYLKEGARRFVLEGRECGGHVGPRSSFLLWEQAVEIVGEAIEQGMTASEVHLLFAGGIHDARSAAIVATIAGSLAERGVRIGVLVGTAYLFTEEAVSTGAIVPGFQAEAVRCARTVLLETGPGHEVRVSPTPFTDSFDRERKRLLSDGQSADQVRRTLEDLNVGRLRVASKGLERSNGIGSSLAPVAAEDQRANGLYMLGQIAALRAGVTTIADLHRDICEGGTAWLDCFADDEVETPTEPSGPPSEIAIVGMAAVFPGAADVRTFWENTLRGHDAITEIPADRWDWRLYYDPDPKAPDKITSKWGGFLPEIPFDPLRYGMPPTSLPSIEPLHLITLEVVRSALEDAGYRDRPFPRERTSVVLGAGGGAAQLAMGYAFRSYLPMLDTVIPGGGREALARSGQVLPEWTEDSFPGILLNVAAGRVANRFDLGGSNYTVDAACGSSLAAAALAVRELEVGAADMVILGGADTVQNPFTYLAFSKTQAFSPQGRCRPFDAGADGIVISEGVAALVLKRLADAERDGDRIYAVFKGLGASSDGRAKGLTAPRPEGQVRALRRAYAKAAVAPATVGYVEAHGTGTAAGDLAEVAALSEVFGQSGTPRAACALGSVKSQIGHTKCAAGLAGLINAALALYHKVLPPTIGVVTPNPRANLAESPFHVNTTTRPWLHSDPEQPRRAGVSAFGFGGTNFHAVLEAYDRDLLDRPSPVCDWPAELLVWRAPDRERLDADIARLQQALARGARPHLRDLAHTLASVAESSVQGANKGPILAIVATSGEDLGAKLVQAREVIASGQARRDDPRGCYFAEAPTLAGSPIAFVFPGQGSQSVNMLGELAVAFPELRQAFDEFDAALKVRGHRPVGPLVFPPPAFDEEARESQRSALRAPDVAQPAVGAACVGLLRVLGSFGLKPDIVAGHSYGELVALHAAGSFSLEALAEMSEARGRLLLAAAGDQPGAMAALTAGPAQIQGLLAGLEGVHPVNWNGPSQTVISGQRAAVIEATERAQAAGIRAQLLPVACAFHSPIVAGAREPLRTLVASLAPRAPEMPVYANATAAPYPRDPSAIAPALGSHLAQPVRFAEMIEAMYVKGARVFVEVGPGGIVSALIGSILAGKPHVALACDHPGRPGVTNLLHVLGRLFVAGAPVRFERLTAGRSARRLDPRRYEPEADAEALSPSTWMVDGARARPLHGPASPRFGQGSALPIAKFAPDPLPFESTALHGLVERNGIDKALRSRFEAIAPETPAPSAPDRVLEAFQKTMQTFLEVQQKTMLAYLARQQGTAIGHPSVKDAPKPNDAARPSAEAKSPLFPNATTPPPEQNGHRSNGDVSHNANSPRQDKNEDVAATRETLERRLLRIVQERTGYPAEMLRLDLDLEADLGIDSIKRVEILGILREALPAHSGGSETEIMDDLSRARTLGAIVERLARAPDGSSRGARNTPGDHLTPTPGRNGSDGERTPAPSSNGQSHSPTAAEPAPTSRVLRRRLELVEAPLPKGTTALAPGGVVLVTDDGRGIARAVAADLRALGHRVVVVRHGPGNGEGEAVNLTSAASVSALLDRVRTQGPLVAIVHAMPLRDLPSAGLDPEAWGARMGTEVRGLFLLARGAADDLARAADRGGASLIAATAMGGAFASVETPSDAFFPGHGALAGLLKTLSLEWPGVRARIVDQDPRREVEVIAADLVQELMTDDSRSEVGYRLGQRVALRHVATPLREHDGAGIALTAGEPLLVTGGARGITAAVVADLARRWRPTLLLVGTSPLPSNAEDLDTAGVTSAAELKALLLARLRGEGQPVGPADVERVYQALRREREIRANLSAFRAAGATLEYARVDVRDSAALARALGDWERRFGPPAGVIHGAGVIQDKLLCDKTPESFDRVLGTKLDGALSLARLLRPESLKFAAFFSSVAGRFGNRGQGDYAAANEALNKLALWLDRRWPCRVVSMIWGPWSGVGMVSDLESHLGRRGLGMILPEDGCSRLADELRWGRKGEVEVIVAGDLGQLGEAAPRRAKPAARHPSPLIL